MGLFRKRSKPWQPSGNHRRGNHRFRGYRFVVTGQSSNNQPALTGTKRGNSLETAAVETTSNRGNHPGNLAVETVGFPANQSANLCCASQLFWGLPATATATFCAYRTAYLGGAHTCFAVTVAVTGAPNHKVGYSKVLP
jgi:hypothetical protein